MNIWEAMAAAQIEEGVDSFDLTPLIQGQLEKSVQNEAEISSASIVKNDTLNNERDMTKSCS